MTLIPPDKSEYNDISSKSGQILAEHVNRLTFRVIFDIPEGVADKAVDMCIAEGKDIEWLKENYPEELV